MDAQPIYLPAPAVTQLVADAIAWEAKRAAHKTLQRHRRVDGWSFTLGERVKAALCAKYQRAMMTQGLEVVTPIHFQPMTRVHRAHLFELLEAHGLRVEVTALPSGTFSSARVFVVAAEERLAAATQRPLLTQDQQDEIVGTAVVVCDPSDLDWREFRLLQQDGTRRSYRVSVDDEGYGPFLVWEILLNDSWQELAGPQETLMQAFVIDTLEKTLP